MNFLSEEKLFNKFKNLKQPTMTAAIQIGNKFRFSDIKEDYFFGGIDFKEGVPVIYFWDRSNRLMGRQGVYLSDLIRIN